MNSVLEKELLSERNSHYKDLKEKCIALKEKCIALQEKCIALKEKCIALKESDVAREFGCTIIDHVSSRCQPRTYASLVDKHL